MSLPQIKGWCPGALRPMASGDGLIVRVRPHCGRLSREQAAGIAALAGRHGNGIIELTGRANVQLRGVRPDTHEPLLDGLDALGLLDADRAREARRNVVVTPLWEADDGTTALAARLEAALADAPPLPEKFGFAVDTGAAPVLTRVPADIRLERAGDGQVILRADGADAGMPVHIDTAADEALALARWFLASGGAPDGRGRMARHLACGARLPDRFAPDLAPARPAAAPLPGRHAHGLFAGFAFGQLTASMLAAIGEQAQAVRVTPWRMLLLEGASDAPDIEGQIVDAEDPRLRIAACAGAPDCPQGALATRPLAAALAPHLPQGALLHVSGCAKGCAHPAPARFTLVATPAGFDLVRDGAAGGTPCRQAMAADDLHARPWRLFEGA